MTAVPLLVQCARCDGKPYHFDRGCAACDDVGYVSPPVVPVPRWPMPEAAQEAAWLALRRPLLAARVLDVDAAARRLVAALEAGPQPARVLAIVQRVAGVDEATARAVVVAYAQAVDEHGRILDAHHRYDRERCRDGERLCQHARRVESCLPPHERWLR